MNTFVVTVGVVAFVGCTAVTVLLLRDTFIGSSDRGPVVLAFITLLAYRTPIALWTVVQLERYFTAPQRVAEYAELPTEEALLSAVDGKAAELPEASSAESLWSGGDGSIVFEHISMRYTPELPLVLQDISFSLQAGQKCGICGRTGAGEHEC